MSNKEDLGLAGYILGIISIVFAFINPIAGLVVGAIGMFLSKKQNTVTAKFGVKLNKIGIIISIIVLIISGIILYYSIINGVSGANPFQ